MDTDPVVRDFARKNPSTWRPLKDALVRNEWITYLWRWRDIYRCRMSTIAWIQAAFAMPFIPTYYKRVARVFAKAARARARDFARGEREPAAPTKPFKGF